MGALAVLLFQRAGRQHQRRRTLALEAGVVAGIALQLPVVDVHDHVHHAVEEIAVVRDDEQRAGIALQPVFQPDDGVQIEVVGRFVQQQQVGRAHQRLRQVQPHAPAAGKAGDRLLHLLQREAQAGQQLLGARAHGIGVGVGQRGVDFADPLAVVGGLGGGQLGLQPAQRDVAVDRVFERRALQRRGFLGHVGDPPLARIIDLAAVGMQFVAQQAEQAGLAGAVGADQADLVARVERDVGVFQQRLDAANQGNLLKTDHYSNMWEYGIKHAISRLFYLWFQKYV